MEFYLELLFASIIIFLILIYLVFINLKNYYNFVNIRKFSETLPGPTVRELIENIKKGNILEWLRALKNEHGKTFCIWLGKDLTIFFTDPEDAKEILSSNKLLYKSNNYKFLSSWLGMGLLTNGGESWHRRRKMLTPAFHFKILETFKPSMEYNCEILIKKLKSKSESGEEFDIYPYITLFALDVICETAMGVQKNAQLKAESEYVKAVQLITKILHKQSFSFWQRFQFVFNFTKAGKLKKQALKILHNETNRVINLRRKLLMDETENFKKLESLDDFIESKKRFAFLDMLLFTQQQGQPLSDKDIREEVDTFMFEGHDTTSSTISFAIYLLSQYPEVQEKAYLEAIEFQGHENNSMKYLEAVIKETLRLYPAVPFFSRMANEDIKIGKINVPKGVAISCLTYLVHRDSDWYIEPNKFNPERHLSSDNKIHPFAYVAFSAGPRNCIGQKFAILELKCTLAKILRAYEILPAKNFEPILLAELVLKSGNGIRVQLRSRKN